MTAHTQNLLMALTCSLLLCGCGGKKSKVTSAASSFEELAAQSLGQQVAAAQSGEGSVLWLHAERNGQIISARRSGLKSGIKSSGLNLVDAPMPGNVVMPGMGEPLRPEWLAELAAEHPSVKAIILDVQGAAALAGSSTASGGLPVYGLQWEDNATTQKLLGSAALSGAVIIKKDADWTKMPKDGKNDEERFAFRYQYLPEE